jgi:hypothetical protein
VAALKTNALHRLGWARLRNFFLIEMKTLAMKAVQVLRVHQQALFHALVLALWQLLPLLHLRHKKWFLHL